jgi:hypothetical protein
MLEAYSVLTRLPSGLAVAGPTAADVLDRRFPEPAIGLDGAARDDLLRTLAGAAVIGGSAYDGLVALEAKAAGRTLLTLDRRAQETYRRLGASFRAIDAPTTR